MLNKTYNPNKKMKTSLIRISIRRWWSSKILYLRSEIPQERYAILLRSSILITAGSFIAILETFIAIYLALHHMPYKQVIFIAIFVLSMTSVLILITYFKKNLLVWHEWAVFGLYLFLFQTGYCLWVYRLGEMRFLAIVNALTIIIILLSYTNIIQSFLISSLVLINYYSVSWYSIKIAGQPGSLIKEAFFSFSLIPSFILISSATYFINKKRKDLERAKSELEKLNNNLGDVNDKLKKEQMLTDIEMDLASEIQKAIFPARVPHTSDWDIAFITKPYGAVSGDFYDFYITEDSLKGLSLFDVSGHGVAPALITILAKPLLYTNFIRCKSERLGAVLESANTALVDELEEVNLYITGLILRMNGSDVEYVNAGHPDLLYLQSSEKKIRIVKDDADSFKGCPVGLNLSNKKYQSVKFNVPSGDYLILYSDGLTESKNSEGNQYGIKRLSDVIVSSCCNDAAGLLEDIIFSLNSFTGNTKPGDDITIIVAGKN